LAKGLHPKMLLMNFIAVLQSNVAFQSGVTVLVERMELVEESREGISPAIVVAIHR
jgi:hypothetical protein